MEFDLPNNITVSVCMIAYNQGSFIEESIKGILMQEADFPIRLVIGEDCSTDETSDICALYAKKHPDKIKLLKTNKNLGIQQNVFRTIEACQDATYIAFCEGDDVWTDINKLKYQVDFLERNEKFLAHAHNVTKRNLISNEDKDFNIRVDKEPMSSELFSDRLFHLVSLMVRGEVLRSIPVNQLPSFISCDRFLTMWIGCHGTMFYEGSKCFATYHLHQYGASSNSNMAKVREEDLKMLDFFRPYFNNELEYKEIRLQAIKSLLFTSLKLNYKFSLNKFSLLVDFFRLSSIDKSFVWFVLVLVFGSPFYKFYKFLKKS